MPLVTSTYSNTDMMSQGYDFQFIQQAVPEAGTLTAIGMGALAALSALGTAVLAPPAAVGADTSTTGSQTTTAAAPATSQRVQHVTRYVQLQPGQTPPPNAAVQPVATPQPRIVIVTRQSGAKP
jgi:hypothetical protein